MVLRDSDVGLEVPGRNLYAPRLRRPIHPGLWSQVVTRSRAEGKGGATAKRVQELAMWRVGSHTSAESELAAVERMTHGARMAATGTACE